LRESEEELNLAGGFARIFPSPSSHIYSPLFPTRYIHVYTHTLCKGTNNQLLLHWVQRCVCVCVCVCVFVCVHVYVYVYVYVCICIFFIHSPFMKQILNRTQNHEAFTA
jgi:hypothetical protein